MYKMILGDTWAWESLLEIGQQDAFGGAEEFLLDIMRQKWLPVLNIVFDFMQTIP